MVYGHRDLFESPLQMKQLLAAIGLIDAFQRLIVASDTLTARKTPFCNKTLACVEHSRATTKLLDRCQSGTFEVEHEVMGLVHRCCYYVL